MKNEKLVYEEANLEIVNLGAEDVITTSGPIAGAFDGKGEDISFKA